MRLIKFSILFVTTFLFFTTAFGQRTVFVKGGADDYRGLMITTTPSGADVNINGKNMGKTPLTLGRQNDGKSNWGTFNGIDVGDTWKLLIYITKDGYEDYIEQINVQSNSSYSEWGILKFNLEKSTNVTPQPPVVKPASQPNPALSDNIIRWKIESDPNGSRIFWRVISNTPEVKNTNETYLTATPYEETRSFNISGLTYENAGNVTIEIKVTRKGYIDQVKRFNVRQAIDQQEINTFFDLVPAE